MTNGELADAVCGATLPITVSMSKEGIFLRVGEKQHAITEHQAEIVFNALQMIVRPSALAPADRKAEAQ